MPVVYGWQKEVPIAEARATFAQGAVENGDARLTAATAEATQRRAEANAAYDRARLAGVELPTVERSLRILQNRKAEIEQEIAAVNNIIDNRRSNDVPSEAIQRINELRAELNGSDDDGLDKKISDLTGKAAQLRTRVAAGTERRGLRRLFRRAA